MMKFVSVRRITVGVVVLLAAANAALTATTLYVSLRGRPTLVVPGIKREQVNLPSHVPDEALRHFAILYLLYFDDYSPATAVDRANYLLRLVSADRVETARRALEERASYVVRARESAQLSPPLPEEVQVERLKNGRYRMSLRALRRTLIADAPKELLEVRYGIEVAPAVPSVTNPFGLVVTDQTIETRMAPGSEAKEEKNGR
jgi:hypothetical protein